MQLCQADGCSKKATRNFVRAPNVFNCTFHANKVPIQSKPIGADTYERYVPENNGSATNTQVSATTTNTQVNGANTTNINLGYWGAEEFGPNVYVANSLSLKDMAYGAVGGLFTFNRTDGTFQTSEWDGLHFVEATMLDQTYFDLYKKNKPTNALLPVWFSCVKRIVDEDAELKGKVIFSSYLRQGQNKKKHSYRAQFLAALLAARKGEAPSVLTSASPILAELREKRYQWFVDDAVDWINKIENGPEQVIQVVKSDQEQEEQEEQEEQDQEQDQEDQEEAKDGAKQEEVDQELVASTRVDYFNDCTIEMSGERDCRSPFVDSHKTDNYTRATKIQALFRGYLVRKAGAKQNESNMEVEQDPEEKAKDEAKPRKSCLKRKHDGDEGNNKRVRFDVEAKDGAQVNDAEQEQEAQEVSINLFKKNGRIDKNIAWYAKNKEGKSFKLQVVKSKASYQLYEEPHGIDDADGKTKYKLQKTPTKRTISALKKRLNNYKSPQKMPYRLTIETEEELKGFTTL